VSVRGGARPAVGGEGPEGPWPGEIPLKDLTVRRFAGRCALVTGASRGIGRAVACQLAQEGASVIVSYAAGARDAQAVVDEIAAAGGTALAFAADVRDEAAVKSLVRFTNQAFGRIDVLVAAAGVVRDQLASTMTLDQWETVIQTNLRGPFLCIREVLPFMMRQRSGNIVCVSSIAAERGGRGHANYVASKGGVNSLVRSLAVELARKHIRVNAVSPGIVATDMSQRIRDLADQDIITQIPLRRYGQPEEVARAVCFLASDEASYITGEILRVTGGFGL
jgi:3-oxoacyl-[acyl-carrier protein] reductase